MSFYEGKKELLIIIPAYNEEKSIGAVLDELLQLPLFGIADVLVIDDASRDDTAKLARARGVQVITQMYHMGYGAGLQLGYRYAVLHGFSYVIQMDADGQHDVSNVMKLFDRLRTPDEAGNYSDLILGSRFLEGAPDYPVSFAKKAAYAMFRGIIRLFTGKRITDPTTGLQRCDNGPDIIGAHDTVANLVFQYSQHLCESFPHNRIRSFIHNGKYLYCRYSRKALYLQYPQQSKTAGLIRKDF